MSAPKPDAAHRTRQNIIDAVVSVVEAASLEELALEAVAKQAGVARATIYRHFPGGRDELVRATIEREVANFWRDLALAVEAEADLEGRLVRGLMIANQRIRDHDLLQRLLRYEPDELLHVLIESEPLVHTVLRDYLRGFLDPAPRRDGLDIDEASDYLTRMLLSHIGTAGRWDMDDEESVRRLVRTQFLTGIVDG